MTCLLMRAAERAQLAMMLEVCAYPKPGNVDRCHDYPDTRLEHFLASTIFARTALEEAETGTGRIGEIIKHAVRDTNCHEGGNTHFGAFILLIPLVYGRDISRRTVRNRKNRCIGRRRFLQSLCNDLRQNESYRRA